MRLLRKPRRAAINAAAEDIKLRWLALSRDQQLAALRFTDREVVARAYHIQKMLYSSEITCYRNGINLKFDQAGQAIVSTGLVHFKFEFAPAEPELPVAVSATPQLLELQDLFGYMVARLGSVFPGGAVLRRNDMASTLDPVPNSWTEFETQLLRLVEVRIYQHSMAPDGSRSHAAASGGAPEQQNLPELEDLELLASLESSTSGKKRSRKRGNASSLTATSAAQEVVQRSQAVAESEEKIQEPEEPIDKAVGAEELGEASLPSARQDEDLTSWTTIWRKARKPSAHIPSEANSSSCSTTSGHSRNSSLMTEASKEALAQFEYEEPAALLETWVPHGPRGRVKEWLLAGTSLRACVKQTFWEVQCMPQQQRRTRSLDVTAVT